MIAQLQQSYLDAIEMLEDGIRKIPDDYWCQGSDDYLVPARIAYHIVVGLEWLVTALPPQEHLKQRRYHLGWLAPLDEYPDRPAMLAELTLMTDRVKEWFENWEQEAANGTAHPLNLKKALYFLRHTQHHLGELSAAARLFGLPRPSWKFLSEKAAVLIQAADTPG